MTKASSKNPQNTQTGGINRVLDALVPSRRVATEAHLQNARLESFLRALPFEYCGWNDLGIQAISPLFARLLDSQNVTTLHDIQAALSPLDASALEGFYDRLKKDGERFDMDVVLPRVQKVLRLIGKNGGVSGESETFHVIFAYDATLEAEHIDDFARSLTLAERREDELKRALNVLPVAVWTRSDSLDIAWCNKTYAQMVDDTQAAVVADQKELHGIGKNKDWTSRLLAQKALAQSAPVSERQHLVVGGRRHLVEITETPAVGGISSVGCAIDVTGEEEAKSAHERFAGTQREVMEQLRAAVAIFDHEARLDFYNTAYEQLWGLDSAWLNTRPKMAEVLDKLRETRRLPEQVDYRQYKQSWASMFTSLLASHEEMLYLPDGTVLRMVVVPRATGGLILTYEDVTSRLQLESSYNILVAVQKETIDNLSDGIAVFGEDGRLKLCNPAFSRIWGIHSELLEGTPHITQIIDRMQKFFKESDWPRARQELLRNGLDRSSLKGRLVRSDNVVLDYSVAPLPDGNVLNTYIDVTSEARVEEALLEKNAALEEAEKLKSDFLANVSYQLRTPLNALTGFAEVLNHQYFGKLNERQLEYTAGMIEAGQKLVSLIDDILDLASIEAGYLELTVSSVDVRVLLQSVETLTSEWARKEGRSIRLVCPKTIGTVSADERRLKQVLVNLIRNAINFSCEKDEIVMFAERRPGSVVISVTDHGAGIPAQELQRIWQPFEKTQSSKATKRGGAGIGLSLVKNIIEMHGGSVALESEEGKGTTVTCTLPDVAVLDV